jgi:hypothetical protein
LAVPASSHRARKVGTPEVGHPVHVAYLEPVAGAADGWNVAVLITVGFSLLGALIVLLARDRAATGQRVPLPRYTPHRPSRDRISKGPR